MDKNKLLNNIIQYSQIKQVFCLLLYCQLLEALLQTLTGSLPLDSAADVGPQTL